MESEGGAVGSEGEALGFAGELAMDVTVESDGDAPHVQAGELATG